MEITTATQREDDARSGRRSARYLARWQEANLPPAPGGGWRLWIGMLGPGVVLAGTSIATGEWLFGPAVTAQYGATLLWLATVSIVLQVFCNLMMMRYTLYCGEPIVVGAMRTPPGPMLWVFVYAVLDIASIWPYNASNAAVPLAAALLGRLPATSADYHLVKFLGYAIFLACFVPLIFGGTVYRMLEKIMTAKLVLVLGYLLLVCAFMVSGNVAWEVVRGFFKFGVVPIRADTLVVNEHFTLSESRDGVRFMLRGTFDGSTLVAGAFSVQTGETIDNFSADSALPEEKWSAIRESMIARARRLARPGHFYLERHAGEETWIAEGTVDEDQFWHPTHWTIERGGEIFEYQTLEDIPEPARGQLASLVEDRGVEQVQLWRYCRDHGRLPDLDWGTLVAFCGIAGAGGLANTLFSNYARDKGWGMGAAVGAIPSAVGGRTIPLSHVGKVFPLTPDNRAHWRGWIRHIVRDQVAVWMICSFLGMALPCMLSLEFIRNATVEGNRVAAMTAEGMSARYPEYRSLFWSVTLLCGFMVLAPGQVSIGDQIARRWTDIIWTGSTWAKRFAGTDVRYVYYGILTIYGAWGLFALALFNPLQIAKIGAVLGNIALGISTLHALYVNRHLLPEDLRPHWLLQWGTGICGVFFLAISGVVIATL